MVYSCGRSVCLLSVDGKADVLATLPADAAGLLVTDRHLVAAAKDGHVTVCQRQTLETVSSHRCASGITSLGSVPWIGDQRVLLATADGPVLCVGLEDSALTHYTSGHRGLCDVTGGPGVIAALSPDRQRLVSWLTWQNDRPRELHVASLLRHRAAGLCIA
jgi:hypothetical protein